jgi:hypothetical protein
MNDSASTITNITEDHVIAAIRSSQRRLLVIAPGLSERVAVALAERWRVLGAEAVDVILDVDPEVCRLGYGEMKSVQLLQKVAGELKTGVRHQAGTRICIVIADDTTLIYSPTPLVVEAKPLTPTHPNGICLRSVPLELAEEAKLDAEKGSEPLVGAGLVSKEVVENLISDLAENPPRKFDLTQRVQVFNAAFEFVEFKLEGCSIARKTVRLPSDLVVAARDQQTRNRVNSNFHLIDKNNRRLSGERVLNLKEFVSRKFLVNLPNYGNVVLRTNKSDFEGAVKTLIHYVERFQKRVKKELQAAIDESRKSLVEALLPAVKINPPSRSIKHIGGNPNEEAVRGWLDAELAYIFGDAGQHISEMKVSVLFKGVTYESLNDPNFIETAKKHLPTLKKLHDEFDTAKAVQENSGQAKPLQEDLFDESSEAVN